MSRNTALGPRNLSVVDSLAPVSRAVLSAVNSEQCKQLALYTIWHIALYEASTAPSAECKKAPESIHTLLQSRENVRNASSRLDGERSNFHLLTEYRELGRSAKKADQF